LKIPCDVLTIDNEPWQIRVLAWFSCFKFNVSGSVYFLVDTGASASLLSERDAKALGVDYDRLELQKDPSVGLGGTLPLYRMKAECRLTFRTSDQTACVHTMPHFDAVKVDIPDPEKRKLVFDGLPSLLGMDLIPKFKFVATRQTAYFEY